MLNKLLQFIRQEKLISPGDTVVCAVSGGADSMALLWAMYLLREKLGITLAAAHFNHRLRGAESDRDEAFVREFCDSHGIVCHCGSGAVIPGEKGLEAAAREARYGFLRSLPGKIATAHTAGDNAETVLMHLLRGTGLKGLGGIAPVNGNVIRPMLSVTRQKVLAFLEEYHIPYVEDSTNGENAYLRNRLRHFVVPLLEQENPRFAENVSAMALGLRQDTDFLESQLETTRDVARLQTMHPALRKRVLAAFLEECGMKEPEKEHISLAESLVFSQKPSAKAVFPGEVVICRNYGTLGKQQSLPALEKTELTCPATVHIPGYRVTCALTDTQVNTPLCFTVQPGNGFCVRARQSGDTIRLTGGTKTLKKLYIDRKIPAHLRARIPVIADDDGVLGVCGFGADHSQEQNNAPLVQITFEKV